MTLAQKLDMIDEWLNERSNDAIFLWDILTALRGPDDDDPFVKEQFTTKIRTRAFPKTATNSYTDKPFGIPAYFASPDDDLKIDFAETPFSSSHFLNHVVHAVNALNAAKR